MTRLALAAGLERRITVRFTALIVCVLTLGIVTFVATDAVVAQRRLDASLRLRAEQTAQRISHSGSMELPADARIVVRDAVSRAGEDVTGIQDVGPLSGFAFADSPRGMLRVYAVPLGDGGSLQLLDAAHPDVGDTLSSALILLVIAVFVGAITYALGLGFARRALAPVRESMARLERFSADAGHELRTPLAAAMASLDVAEKTGDWQGAGARARVALKDASALVDKLLELARLDPSTLHPEPVDARALLRRVADSCASLAEGRSVLLVIDADDGTVVADPVLLERLATNLTANALRFATPGTASTLSLHDGVLGVHNLGPEIPAEDLPRIFEPFNQLDRSRSGEGAGLGLAIVYAIADAHGWGLHVASSTEDGTRFSVDMSPAWRRRP
jgi:signal transduction histidine kinase